MPFVHDGSTRVVWTRERLSELNLRVAHSPDMPPEEICRVVSELFDKEDFDNHNERSALADGTVRPEDFASVDRALDALNRIIGRDGLEAYLEKSGVCRMRNTGTGFTSANLTQQNRPLSQEEIAQREKLARYLKNASEDEFTTKVLVPLFQRLGFRRVSATGHKDKSLEFGKDLWMKYQLPTGHWLYFCAQVKKDKIDSNNASGQRNVSSVVTQARMAFDHPIFDPEANRKVLLDHLYLISAGEITKAARAWIIEHLDAGQRRHIIFMDKDELLDHSARILLDLQIEEPTPMISNDLGF